LEYFVVTKSDKFKQYKLSLALRGSFARRKQARNLAFRFILWLHNMYLDTWKL